MHNKIGPLEFDIPSMGTIYHRIFLYNQQWQIVFIKYDRIDEEPAILVKAKPKQIYVINCNCNGASGLLLISKPTGERITTNDTFKALSCEVQPIWRGYTVLLAVWIFVCFRDLLRSKKRFHDLFVVQIA